VSVFDRLSATSIVALKKINPSSYRTGVVELSIFLDALRSVDPNLKVFLKKIPLSKRKDILISIQKVVLYAFHEAHLDNSETVEPFHLAIAVYHQVDIEKYFAFKHLVRGEMKKEEASQFGTFVKNLTSKESIKNTPHFIGREDELTKLIIGLVSKNAKPVLLVGNEGVGKTSLVMELAKRIKKGKVPYSLLNSRILRIRFPALLGLLPIDGNVPPGVLISKFLTALVNSEKKEGEKTIVFIDDLKIGSNFIFGIEPDSLNDDVLLIGAYEEDSAINIPEESLSKLWEIVRFGEYEKNSLKTVMKKYAKDMKRFANVEFEDMAVEEIINKTMDGDDEYALPGGVLDIMQRLVIYKQHSATDYDVQEVLYKDIMREKDITKSQVLLNTLGEIAIAPLTITRDDVELYFKLLNGDSEIIVSSDQKFSSSKLLKIENELKKYIVGQDVALEALGRALRISSLKLGSKYKPIGSFLFLGPTGVEKTETAKALAKVLYGTRGKNKLKPENFIRIDMSEYSEKHSVSKLFGAPPGYVGYDDGAILADYLKEHPSCVVLFDEIDKAHPEVLNSLLHIMEEGEIRDNTGEYVSFENAIILMTSNHGAELIDKKDIGFSKDIDKNAEMEKLLIDNLKKELKPEFINRFDDIVVYKKLRKVDFEKILDLILEPIINSLKERGIKFKILVGAKKWLVEKGASDEFGARELRRVVNKELVDLISKILLKDESKKKITIAVGKDKKKLIVK